MNRIEKIHVKSKKVSCNGGVNSSAHQTVYLKIGKDGSVICPYCARCYTVLETGCDERKQKVEKPHE